MQNQRTIALTALVVSLACIQGAWGQSGRSGLGRIEAESATSLSGGSLRIERTAAGGHVSGIGHNTWILFKAVSLPQSNQGYNIKARGMNPAGAPSGFAMEVRLDSPTGLNTGVVTINSNISGPNKAAVVTDRLSGLGGGVKDVYLRFLGAAGQELGSLDWIEFIAGPVNPGAVYEQLAAVSGVPVNTAAGGQGPVFALTDKLPGGTSVNGAVQVPGRTPRPATAWRFTTGGTNMSAPLAASALSPDALTVTAWVKTSSFAGNGSNIIIEKPFAQSPYVPRSFVLAMTGDQYPRATAAFDFRVSTASQAAGGEALAVSAQGTWKPGQWYHLAGVYTGGEIVLYVNGQPAARAPGSGKIRLSDAPLSMGKYSGADLQKLPTTPMDLADVRIYGRALTVAEVQAVMAGQ